MKSKLEIEDRIREVLSEYEELCNAGRAQGDRAQELLVERRTLFDVLDIELCAHNAAIYGSARYSKDKIDGINFALSTSDYKEYIKEKIREIFSEYEELCNAVKAQSER